MHEAGVTMMAATDAGAGDTPFGSSLHDELELMVEAGLTPVEALTAATLTPARFHGVDHQVGSIQAGQRADLVLLGTDPLQDIRNTRSITHVVLGGRAISR